MSTSDACLMQVRCSKWPVLAIHYDRRYEMNRIKGKESLHNMTPGMAKARLLRNWHNETVQLQLGCCQMMTEVAKPLPLWPKMNLVNDDMPVATNEAQITWAHDVIRETLNAWETGTNHCTLHACLQVALARHEQKYKINFIAHDANLEVKQQQPCTSRKTNSLTAFRRI